jgi:hypothetical protein
MSSFLPYVSSATNSNGENSISIDQIFEDFLFNDLSDFDGVNFDMIGDQGSGAARSGREGEDNDKKRKQSNISVDQKKDRR